MGRAGRSVAAATAIVLVLSGCGDTAEDPAAKWAAPGSSQPPAAADRVTDGAAVGGQGEGHPSTGMVDVAGQTHALEAGDFAACLGHVAPDFADVHVVVNLPGSVGEQLVLRGTPGDMETDPREGLFIGGPSGEERGTGLALVREDNRLVGSATFPRGEVSFDVECEPWWSQGDEG